MANGELKSLEEVKQKVYDEINLILGLKKSEKKIEEPINVNRDGCLSALISAGLKLFVPLTLKNVEKQYEFSAYSKRADEVLERKAVKDELCKALNDSMTLPLEIATAITPVLYEHSKAYPDYLAMEPRLFAYIAIKISEKGVKNYC